MYKKKLILLNYRWMIGRDSSGAEKGGERRGEDRGERGMEVRPEKQM